ncbi:hypothetical protein [Arthrobacter sp. Soil762]|uniref:hypothetical protein n=1 Tax=Arthrobacter sp. Soil762 TaxID=1736401 RepID=UPI0012E37021|nr:hypothetical protein [Arthrobacter sp. Soil762]
MATDVVVKKAAFYRAYILKDAARQDPQERDWTAFLSGVAKLPFTERVIDDIVFEPSKFSDGWVLGIHKPINTDFMTRVNAKTGRIADLLDDPEAGDGGLSHSTAVYFTGLGNVFALTGGGGNSSPRSNAVADFLQEFAPPAEGSFWKTEPVMTKDQIEQLRASKGLVEFTSRFSTAQSLFTADDDDTGLVGFAEKLAVRVGGDLEISIQLRLPAESRNKSVKEKLRNLVLGDLPRLAGKGTGAKAKAVLAEGVEEEISLVAHRLAEDFEIGKLGPESRQFSELMQALLNVGAQMEDRVTTILEG